MQTQEQVISYNVILHSLNIFEHLCAEKWRSSNSHQNFLQSRGSILSLAESVQKIAPLSFFP